MTADSSPPPESDTKSSLVGPGAAHIAAWGFAFLLLRIFAVSGYDWDTAFLVSTTIGLDDGLALLFGSLMADYVLTAVLLVCVLPLVIAASIWGSAERRRTRMMFATLGVVVLATLTASFALWWLPVGALSVLAAFALVRRLPPQNALRKTVGTAFAKVGLMIGLATLVVASFVQTPWVPKEEITTAEGTITAYVLSVDSGYLNAITEDQEFVIILNSDVIARK